MKYDKNRFKTPADYVMYLQMLSQDCISLNSPVGDKQGEDYGESELQDFLASDAPTAEEVAIRNSRYDAMMSILNILSPREQQIIKMRFGFDDYEASTLEQIGEHFGVTRERVRQVEAKAIRKLKSILKRKGINKEGDF